MHYRHDFAEPGDQRCSRRAAPARTTETTVQAGNGIVGVLTKPASAQKTPAVLMLHGFGSQKDEVGNMYKRLAESLASRGVASLRIDFRGFGKSDGDTGAITVDPQVEDASTAYDYLSKLDFVDPARIGVMGFSLGGGVATVAAAQNPERCRVVRCEPRRTGVCDGRIRQRTRTFRLSESDLVPQHLLD